MYALVMLLCAVAPSALVEAAGRRVIPRHTGIAVIRRECSGRSTETPSCFVEAAAGYCAGRTSRAYRNRRRCPCSCEFQLNRRVQSCCAAVGEDRRPHCFDMCNLNNTLAKYESRLAMVCATESPVLGYCGWDGNDGRSCCRAKKVPAQCVQLCAAEMTCSAVERIGDLNWCNRYMPRMHQCQIELMKPLPRWRDNWRHPCPK